MPGPDEQKTQCRLLSPTFLGKANPYVSDVACLCVEGMNHAAEQLVEGHLGLIATEAMELVVCRTLAKFGEQLACLF